MFVELEREPGRSHSVARLEVGAARGASSRAITLHRTDRKRIDPSLPEGRRASGYTFSSPCPNCSHRPIGSLAALASSTWQPTMPESVSGSANRTSPHHSDRALRRTLPGCRTRTPWRPNQAINRGQAARKSRAHKLIRSHAIQDHLQARSGSTAGVCRGCTRRVSLGTTQQTEISDRWLVGVHRPAPAAPWGGFRIPSVR